MGWMRANSVEIIKTEDQNETDFTKSLRLLTDPKFSAKVSQIDVIYGIGGLSTSRFDQSFGNFNALFKAWNFLKIPLYLLQRDCIILLLPPGQHKITDLRNCLGRKCGLVPLGSPCRTCKTAGLKWNLGFYAITVEIYKIS